MPYLQRLDSRPTDHDLSEREREHLAKHFDAYGAEVWIDGAGVRWEHIEEIEVAVAARARGPSGWIVKRLVVGGERYHVGVYFGYSEAVLPNLTLNAARYVVQTMAYYAPNRIKFTGPDDITPLIEY